MPKAMTGISEPTPSPNANFTASDYARRAAARLLFAVLEENQSLEEAMSADKGFAKLETRDRAFARALVGATLRWLGAIDGVLANFMEKPLAPGAREARTLLRLGAGQIIGLGTPGHAAVHATVALAKSAPGGRPFAGLINAVLRKVATSGKALADAMPAGERLPRQIWTRWRATYGDATAVAIAQALSTPPPLDLTAKENPAEWAQKLGAVMLPNGSMRLDPAPADVLALEGWAEGAFWVQDAAASIPVKLLAPKASERVADLCAAPGGKSLQIAASGAKLVAIDASAERLDRLRENLARTGLPAEIITGDIERWTPPELFDAVLLDAPCTATGTVRRHPEVVWIRRPEDAGTMGNVQRRMLAAAAKLLRPGGRLVYAVCSLEPEEGPGVVASAAQHSLTPDPIRGDELPNLEHAITPEGFLRLLPSHWADKGGLDGFFVARFVKG